MAKAYGSITIHFSKEVSDEKDIDAIQKIYADLMEMDSVIESIEEDILHHEIMIDGIEYDDNEIIVKYEE